MRTMIVATLALAGLSLAACSKSDTSPRPAHSTVAADMPDAAAVPGAQVVNPPAAGQAAGAGAGAGAGSDGRPGTAQGRNTPAPGTPLTNHP